MKQKAQRSVASRFWPKVDKSAGPNGCWLWMAAKDPLGYGRFGIGRRGACRIWLAHRVAWELVNGPIPDGMCALHNCDNPQCVNPSHLFIGTKADNIRDMDQKGRRRSGPVFGEDNHFAKLTAAQVVEIRNATCSHREIAARFGLHPKHVGDIRRGKAWTELGEKTREYRRFRQTGEASHAAKLTAAQVAEIRLAHGTNRAIAQRFGVSKASVWNILNGRTWTNMEESKCV